MRHRVSLNLFKINPSMNSSKCLCILVLLIGMLRTQAQFYNFSNDIPVTIGGNALQAAWTGGLNAPQLSEIDLDNDGTRDLVVFDRVGPRLLTFRNNGSAG